MIALDEHWVPVEGFPAYEVSNYGRVCNVKTGKDLKPRRQKRSARRMVGLRVNGVRHYWYVHRLVARAFFVDYNESVYVDFINGNIEDVAILNLTLKRRRHRPGPEREFHGLRGETPPA